MGTWHANIAEDNFRLLGRQLLQQLVAVGEAAGLQTRPGECLFQYPANGFVVVNHPDRIVRSHVLMPLVSSLLGGPWLEEPWLEGPWLEGPWLEEPWLDEPCEALSVDGDMTGRCMENRVRPGRLWHSIMPPCWLTMECAIDKPSPAPSARPLIIG